MKIHFSGAKIRETDTTILKKAIKRKQKKKQKSAEAWKSRMEQTKEKMDERMSIRNHNLKQRAVGGAAGANLSRGASRMMKKLMLWVLQELIRRKDQDLVHMLERAAQVLKERSKILSTRAPVRKVSKASR